MTQFKHGFCGCFDNLGLCVITYFLPCYTFGKTSEAVGESCLLCGLIYFVPLVNIAALLTVRGKVRETQGIDGGCITDLMAVICCHFCALVQEAQEMQEPGLLRMARS